MHLDFRSDNPDGDVERLVAGGARLVETKEGRNQTRTVLRDPEDNPFCVE